MNKVTQICSDLIILQIKIVMIVLVLICATVGITVKLTMGETGVHKTRLL